METATVPRQESRFSKSVGTVFSYAIVFCYLAFNAIPFVIKLVLGMMGIHIGSDDPDIEI